MKIDQGLNKQCVEGLAWRQGRGSCLVECLNRRQRRERKLKPYKYRNRIPKTKYPTVGTDADDGQSAPLVSKTTGLSTGMAVTWLGTSSGAPTPYRNVSSIVLRLPEQTLLFDAGEGTQTQLMKAEIFPSSIKKSSPTAHPLLYDTCCRIFVTHLHGDHCFGLPGLLSLINQVRLFHDRGERLDVYGPPGLGELMRMSLPHWFDRFRMAVRIVEFSVSTTVDTTPRPLDPNGHVLLEQMPPTDAIPVDIHRIKLDRGSYGVQLRRGLERGYQWRIDAGNGITVTASQLQHRMPCWGYVIQEQDSIPAQWELDLWKKQQGDPSLDDADAQQALAHCGRKVVILGDTCNSDTLLSIGQNADLLSHEATFSSDMMTKAIRAQHSTAAMAGDFARRLNAKQLVLTHFSPRYRAARSNHETNPADGDVRGLVAEAQRTFGSEAVIAARDFLTCDVPQSPLTKNPVLQSV